MDEQRAPVTHHAEGNDGAKLNDSEGLTHEGVRVAGTVTPSGEVGHAHAGEDQQVHFVHQRHVEGGRADSERLANGTLSLTVDKGYPIGRRGEREVAHLLVTRMQEDGRTVQLKVGDDDRGEDALLLEAGQAFDLQVVSGIAGQEFWDERAAQRSATTQVQPHSEVEWIRGAVTKKVERYPNSAQRANMVLAIDYRFSPLTSGSTTATLYLERYGDSAIDGFREIWLVGHAPSHCARLGPPT